jgi:protein SCO1/2
MSKKAWFLIVFFVALVVSFYVALTGLIPDFRKRELPVLSNLQPFSFTNQAGRIITEKDVQGKVFVAEFFFTTCKGICPKMNRNLEEVYQKFRENPDFRILSHTVDPATDNVARLKQYADSLHADATRWWFVTGSKDSLYSMARVSYLLESRDNDTIPIEEQFIHTQFFSLVDREGRIRKIYDGLKKADLVALEKDITVLLKERPGKARFVNNLFGKNPH